MLYLNNPEVFKKILFKNQRQAFDEWHKKPKPAKAKTLPRLLRNIK